MKTRFGTRVLSQEMKVFFTTQRHIKLYLTHDLYEFFA